MAEDESLLSINSGDVGILTDIKTEPLDNVGVDGYDSGSQLDYDLDPTKMHTESSWYTPGSGLHGLDGFDDFNYNTPLGTFMTSIKDEPDDIEPLDCEKPLDTNSVDAKPLGLCEQDEPSLTNHTIPGVVSIPQIKNINSVPKREAGISIPEKIPPSSLSRGSGQSSRMTIRELLEKNERKKNHDTGKFIKISPTHSQVMHLGNLSVRPVKLIASPAAIEKLAPQNVTEVAPSAVDGVNLSVDRHDACREEPSPGVSMIISAKLSDEKEDSEWFVLKFVANHSQSFACTVCSKSYGCLTELQRHVKENLNSHQACLSISKIFNSQVSITTPSILSSDSGSDLSKSSTDGSLDGPLPVVTGKHSESENNGKATLYPCRFCGKVFLDPASCWKHEGSAHLGATNTTAKIEGPDALVVSSTKDGNGQSFVAMQGWLCASPDSSLPPGIKRYRCSFCNRAFQSQFYWEAHEKSHVGMKKNIQLNKPHKCSFCCKTFAYLANLKAHERTHDSQEYEDLKNKIFECKQCRKSFSSKVYLDEHNRSTAHGRKECKDGEMPVDGADQCDGQETQLETVDVETEEMEEENPRYECSHCGRKFHRKFHWEAHEQAHISNKQPAGNTKQYRCTYCGQAFISQFYWEAHEHMHAARDSVEKVPVSKRYKCSRCDKSFAYHSNLESHERAHDSGAISTQNEGNIVDDPSDYQHKCSFCPKAYKTVSGKSRHEKVHHASELENLIRPQYAAASAKSQFKIHSCSQCTQQFASEAALKLHSEKHPPVECEVCGKTFTDRPTLKEHSLTCAKDLLHYDSDDDTVDVEHEGDEDNDMDELTGSDVGDV